MIISPVDKNTFPLVSQFILPHEEKCIFLASQIRRQTESLFVIAKNKEIKTTADIIAVLYVDSSLFHCIPYPQEVNPSELSTLLKSADINLKKIKCISGEAKATALLVDALQSEIRTPYQTNHYKLMTCTLPVNPETPLCNDDQIIRCTQNDMELLLPIQKKYLNEEVAPYGRTVSDAEVSIGLRQILKNQLVLALQSDGEIVAKANTNAIGINWIQLGGIYTHPLYRRNGYAWQLISAICRRTSSAGKKSALFVKDINVPAMELYKKLGFTEGGFYEICYY